MEEQTTERRSDRSDIRIEAVQKQLRHVAEDGAIDLMLVADKRGGLVGAVEGADRDRAEELAAMSGTLYEFRETLLQSADIRDMMDIAIRQTSGRRLTCRFFEFRRTSLVLMAVTRGWEIAEDLLDRVVTGVHRILEAKDLKGLEDWHPPE